MKHGHEVLGKDALALLQGYESGGDCVAFLSGLPLFAPELESALNTIAERLPSASRRSVLGSCQQPCCSRGRALDWWHCSVPLGRFA